MACLTGIKGPQITSILSPIVDTRAMSNQCALDAQGNALPAEAITFYHSESDEVPIPKGATSIPFPLHNHSM